MELPKDLPKPTDVLQREDYYDRYVAPAMLEIAEFCRENDMSILATVQYNPSETGRGTTVILGDDAHQQIRMAKVLLLNGLHHMMGLIPEPEVRKPGVPG